MSRLAALALFATLSACAPAAKPPATGLSITAAQLAPPPVPAGGTVAEQRKGYLAAVHTLLRPRWDLVRSKASAILPPTHPANQLARITELSARLDRAGKIKSVAVVKGSGYTPFDESVQAALEHIPRLPALPPALRRGHVELRWILHRDERSCGVEHARLVLHPLSPAEAFSDALAAGQLEQAYSILSAAPARQGLLTILARRGLSASGDGPARRLALELAPEPLLVTLLTRQPGSPAWQPAVQQLEKRGAAGVLNKELARVSRSAHSAGKVRRVSVLVAALKRLKASPESAVMARLMKSTDAALVLAAAPAVRDPSELQHAMTRFAKQPSVAGTLAIFRLALSASPAATAVFDRAFSGKARGAMLDALQRFPCPALTPRVEALVRSTAVAPALRVRAIQVLGGMTGSTSPFFVALLSRREDVRLAAIEALGRRKDRTSGVSYRLSVVAKWGGKVGAAALVAVARRGVARSLSDTRYLIKVQAKKHRPRVVAAMWGFGEPAVPYLSGLLTHRARDMREAAASSLARIKGAAAARALALYREKNPAPGASAKKPDSELARLMRRVIELGKAKRKR